LESDSEAVIPRSEESGYYISFEIRNKSWSAAENEYPNRAEFTSLDNDCGTFPRDVIAQDKSVDNPINSWRQANTNIKLAIG
jgi:hypothetical protein